VRLRLPNPDHKLPGGLRCKADVMAKASIQPAVAVPPPVTLTPSLSPSLSPSAPPATPQALAPTPPRQEARPEVPALRPLSSAQRADKPFKLSTRLELAPRAEASHGTRL
jgi:hypothetical protein